MLHNHTHETYFTRRTDQTMSSSTYFRSRQEGLLRQGLPFSCADVFPPTEAHQLLTSYTNIIFRRNVLQISIFKPIRWRFGLRVTNLPQTCVVGWGIRGCPHNLVMRSPRKKLVLHLSQHASYRIRWEMHIIPHWTDIPCSTSPHFE